MANPFKIVKDSSIWNNPKNYAATNKMDGLIRVGIVKNAVNDVKTGELRYLVEIQSHSDKIEMNCTMMRRFGGVYNYEDYICRGYTINDKPDPVSYFEAKAGDAVLVSFINGQGREGVILGGINHAARHTIIKATDGPQYKKEFNGVETFINKDGEITVTFKGQPTNLAHLNDTPSSKIPLPTYDTKVGSSFYKFDKTGSWTVSDNSTSGVQSIKIDKPGGIVAILAGNISLKMTKSSEAVTLVCKTADFSVTDKYSIETKEFLTEATTRAYVKSPKVAIGKDGIELLDQLAKLVDALGLVQPISPIGPCSPLKTSPNWPPVEQIKEKIKEITGSF